MYLKKNKKKTFMLIILDPSILEYCYGFETDVCVIPSNFTMFASGDVNILTKSGMYHSLKDLESSQDFDRVGG